VSAAGLYSITHLLHDWVNDVCAPSLRHCRQALQPGGRVILIEPLAGETEAPPLHAQPDLTFMLVRG
jgi:hypothetical protein